MAMMRALMSMVVVVLLLAPSAQAQGPASLDQSFGNSGTLTVGDKLLAVGPHDRLYIAGASLLVTRFHPNGHPDHAFVDEHPVDGVTTSAVAGAPDGGVVVVGRLPAAPGSSTVAVAVLRLDASGRPDSRFGSDGMIQISGTTYTPAVAVGSLGDVYLALRRGVLRLGPDGRPDPTFGLDGVASAGLRPGQEITALHIDHAGALLVREVLPAQTTRDEDQITTVRLTPPGDVDPAFEPVSAYGLTEDPRGGYVAPFTLCEPILSGNYPCGLGYATFDTNGHTMGTTTALRFPETEAAAAAIDADQHVLVLSRNGLLVRLTAEGRRDRTFGQCGITTNAGYGEVAVQANGRILLNDGPGIRALRGGTVSPGVNSAPAVTPVQLPDHHTYLLSSLSIRYRANVNATLTAHLSLTAHHSGHRFRFTRARLARAGIPRVVARTHATVTPCHPATATFHVPRDLRRRIARLTTDPVFTATLRVSNARGHVDATTTYLMGSDGRFSIQLY